MNDGMTYLQAQEAAVRAEIDASIGYTFQKLIDNKAKTAKAISNQKSITAYMTGATEDSSLLGRIGRMLFPKTVPFLTEEMVENNAKFQEYKDILSQQGYEVSLGSVRDNDGIGKVSNYLFGGGLSLMFVACMSGNPALTMLAGTFGGAGTMLGGMLKLDAYPSIEMSFSPKPAAA